MTGLELNDVAKRFGDVTVVQQLDLTVHEGEFMVLLGESGCGKSTTLRMIAGLENVSQGTIHIGDRDVTRLPPMARDIAMVFQNYALYPHMDVAQNMSFALSLSGRPAAEVEAKVAAAARVLNITHLLKRKPKELSGGQRQRVAIGRAIVREPRVFLFDEPLSNLDAKLRGHMRAELALLHERLGKTTVYVTHDQVEAMTLADRIVIFEKGCMQQIGTPSQVFNRPTTVFVAGFVGMPGMNLLPAHFVAHGTGEGVLCGDGFELNAPAWLRDQVTEFDQPLVLGIRPQALRVVAGRAPFNLEIDVVEYLGTESQVVGHLAGSDARRFVATLPGDAHRLLHSTLGLGVGPEDMHVFDAASGQSMYP